LFHVTLLVPRILEMVPRFFNICAPLLQSIFLKTEEFEGASYLQRLNMVNIHFRCGEAYFVCSHTTVSFK